MPSLTEIAQQIHNQLHPPFDSISPALEQYKRNMDRAKYEMPKTLNGQMTLVKELAEDSSDQHIIDWLLCYIPASLLKEAAEQAWDEGRDY